MSSSLPAKKSLGQHWLTDPASLEAMCDAADVTASDTVLEIGPGQGSLTRVLLTRAARVIAIEKDKTLAQNLPLLRDSPLAGGENYKFAELEVVAGDILGFDFGQLPAGYKVVANIPYYLTGNLLRVLSEVGNPPAQAALLVQKEVAERVAAAPGAMSLLSVSCQLYWDVSLGLVVPAALFHPPPKVDSRILRLLRQPAGRKDDREERPGVLRLARAGFAARRKTLQNSLSAGLRLSRGDTEKLLEAAGIDGRLRPQNLSLSDWVRLEKCFRSEKPVTGNTGG